MSDRAATSPDNESGQNARALVKPDGLRIVLTALDQGLPHDVEALETSAFLLTIAWAGEKDTSVR
jgi:hypothetical protein